MVPHTALRAGPQTQRHIARSQRKSLLDLLILSGIENLVIACMKAIRAPFVKGLSLEGGIMQTEL